MSVSDYLPYVGVDEITDEKKGGKLGLLKALVAEMIGSAFLVIVGCGSCYKNPGVVPKANQTNQLANETDVVRIALAFGLAVATMAQSIGHISGCHINPAVTAGLFVGAKIGLIKAVLYIVLQCVGALIGAGLLHGITHPLPMGGITLVSDKTNVGQAFGIEFLITMALVLVVFGAAADENNAPSVKGSAPLAIGLSITACHLFAVPFTGSSMNPARSFGPAAIGSNWTNHWVYWIGPILGGVAAGIIYQLVLKAPKADTEPERRETYKAVSQNDQS